MKIGADLGGTKLLMLADRDGEQVSLQVPTGPHFDARALEEALQGFIKGLGTTPLYVGFAIPGLVDAHQKVVACDVLPRLQGVTPNQLAASQCPVFFVNDVEAALIQESAELPEPTTLAVVMVGTGIGMAFQSAAGVWRGAQGWAGELGSTPLAVRDQVTTLDAAASGASILARTGGDIEALTQRLANQDPIALEVVRSAGSALGLGLATVINLLNPAVLCLGGGTLRIAAYAEAALATAKRHTLPDLWHACTLRPPRSGSQVSALGALRFAGKSLVEPRG